MAGDDQLLKDFQKDSLNVVESLLEILDQCEGRVDRIKKLEEYGLLVDRIMGGARSIGTIMGDPHGTLMPLGDYTAVLKTMGYRSAQVAKDQKLYDLVVAVLQDATECLKDLVEHLFDPQIKVKDILPTTLIDRVKWVASQFEALGHQDKKSLKAEKMDQAEIDDLLKKLGL